MEEEEEEERELGQNGGQKHHHPLLPNLDPETVGRMLKQIGATSVADLFADVPEKFILKRKLAIPEGKTEATLRKDVTDVLSRNKTPPEAVCFLGGGVWPHYVPAAVDSIVSRQEFYTSYTPYQPEISQGMLQALFEYQSMMCDLLGMEVCNSSMYDWASAAAEAVRMVVRIKAAGGAGKRVKFLLAGSAGPSRMDVIRTYAQSMDVEFREVGFDRRTGRLDLDSLGKEGEDIAGIYVENPNFFGVIEENVREAIARVHEKGGLAVVGVDPVSLSVLKDPGSYGADVVVGEGQPLGIAMNYGGPHIGIFAVRDTSLARSMPGRLIGLTTTRDGKRRAFCMVLQTREQHIRREGATSNICTNQALLALAATAYLALLGKLGFQRLGEVILANSHYASEMIGRVKGARAPLFEGQFFSDFAVGYERRTSAAEVYEELAKRGILAGYPLEPSRFPGLGSAGAYSVTEVHSAADISRLVGALSEVL